MHRPAWTILQLVVEPGEGAGSVARTYIFLVMRSTFLVSRMGWVRVARGCGPPLRSQNAIIGMFKAELSRRSWRYQPILTRHGGWTPIGRQYAEIGLSVLRHEGVEVDQ